MQWPKWKPNKNQITSQRLPLECFLLDDHAEHNSTQMLQMGPNPKHLNPHRGCADPDWPDDGAPADVPAVAGGLPPCHRAPAGWQTQSWPDPGHICQVLAQRLIQADNGCMLSGIWPRTRRMGCTSWRRGWCGGWGWWRPRRTSTRSSSSPRWYSRLSRGSTALLCAFPPCGSTPATISGGL